MASSQDEEVDNILPKDHQTKSNKKLNSAGEASSRNKKSIGKNRLTIQETDSDESEDDEASVTESSQALSLRRNEHIPKNFEHSIGDGKGFFIFDSNSGNTLLNWGVATYKRIMHPDYWVDNTVMDTFLLAVRYHNKNAMFSTDNWELLHKDDLDQAMKNTEVMKERIKKYKNDKRVCRLLVTGGKNRNEMHYQVLVIEREFREVHLIEYTKMSVIHHSQLTGIKDAIISLGWCTKNHLRLSKSQGRGNNPDVKTKRSKWYYNHIHYARPHEFEETRETPDCGPFAALVYLKCMESRDKEFRPEVMVYDEYNKANLRWLFLLKMQKILPLYIDDAVKQRANKQVSDDNEKQHMVYTREFFGLIEEELSEAVDPKDNVNCTCGRKEHKSTNIFIPSCCFRSYHADCYMEHLCMQISENPINFYACNSCDSVSGTLLGVQDHEATNIEAIHNFAETKKEIFKQIMLLSKYDDRHR